MSEHVLKNTQATLSVNFSAGAADASVTVTIVDADGTAVASGTASHGTAGIYSYVLTAQTAVRELTVTWSGTWGGAAESIQHTVEVVGGLLFTLAELRAFANAELTSTTTYPDETLADKRAETTDLFEQICSVSMVPRYNRWVTDGSDRTTLWLPSQRVRSILAVSVNGVAYTAPQLAALKITRFGELWNQGGWPSGSYPNNVVVSYEHGYPTAPARVKTAGMALAHYELTGSRLADRMLTMTNEFGIIRQSIPEGFKRPTGLLFVDATLCQYSENLLEVGV